MKGKLLLIIGDSSALPRPEVPYKKTYEYLLRKKLRKKLIVVNQSSYGNNSKKILKKIKGFCQKNKPIAVILNYGIVDAYPRPLPFQLSRLLSFFKMPLEHTLKKTGYYYKLGDLFNYKVVPLNKYKTYTNEIIIYLKNIGVKKIIVIGIIRAFGKILNSRIAFKEFKKYNGILLDLVKKYKLHFINLSKIPKKYTCKDGYHYNAALNQHLASRIGKILKY